MKIEQISEVTKQTDNVQGIQLRQCPSQGTWLVPLVTLLQGGFWDKQTARIVLGENDPSLEKVQITINIHVFLGTPCIFKICYFVVFCEPADSSTVRDVTTAIEGLGVSLLL